MSLPDIALVSSERGRSRFPLTRLFQYEANRDAMVIYPDSSDLINLCRGNGSISLCELAPKLTADSHRVVLSLETLIELAAPLRNGFLLEVRRDLNLLEQLPLVFVNEGRIANLEIEEAIRAFEQGREYDSTVVDPFARRLADAIDMFGARQFIIEGGMRVPTDILVNYGIAETVLYLWKSDPLTFDVQRRREQAWIQLMESDRSMAVTPDLADHFVTAMERNLPLRGPRPPAQQRSPSGCTNRPRAAPVSGSYMKRIIDSGAIIKLAPERPI